MGRTACRRRPQKDIGRRAHSTVRVPQDVSDVLDTVPSITEYVVTALRAYIAQAANTKPSGINDK